MQFALLQRPLPSLQMVQKVEAHTSTVVAQEGVCPRREACPYAHNVFEYWLHPTRYRTQLCNDDNRCKRRICFFAHTLEELRVPSCKPFVPPEALAAATPSEALTDASGNPSDWNQPFGISRVRISYI